MLFGLHTYWAIFFQNYSGMEQAFNICSPLCDKQFSPPLQGQGKFPPGMILKIFSPKNSAKKFSFLTQKAKLCKKF
jgi:hypothetical protein